MEATRVRRDGKRVLWSLSQPMTHDYITFTHVISSAVVTMDHGPETYLFSCDGDGEVLSWVELPGSFTGSLDHQRAMDGFLEWANSQEESSCE